MSKNRLQSYSAAEVDIPVKMLKQPGLIDGFCTGVISPVHIQFIPTNRCNANCSFCSCAGRDKGLEFPFDNVRETIRTFARLGTKAVTITGGGEPTLYRQFGPLLDEFYRAGIQIGIVCNGLNYKQWNYAHMNKRVTWIRMSISDEYDIGGLNEKIYHIRGNLPNVDMALSYVVTENPNPEKMREALEVANRYGLTHIRFVNDINRDFFINSDRVFEGIDTNRAIIQQRRSSTTGMQKCLISLLKPVIYPDGYVYPCCGVQYATAAAAAAHEMLPSFRMCSVEDIWDTWKHQAYFDGSVCEKCYYGSYNCILDSATNQIEHEAFV